MARRRRVARRVVLLIAALAALLTLDLGLPALGALGPAGLAAAAGEPASACPDGTRYADGFCVTEAKAKCPEGRKVDGRSCTTPQVAHCEKGEQVGSGCQTPAAAPCPDGGTPSGSDCVSDPSYRCADGTSPVGASCDIGWTQSCGSLTRDGNVCVEPDPPACPAGSLETGRDTANCWGSAVAGSCPGHSQPSAKDASVCVMNATATLGCPTGYTLVTASGESYEPYCASDTDPDASEDPSYTYSCPTGWDLHPGNGDNIPTSCTKSNLTCPSGFASGPSSDGKCSAKLTCSAGSLDKSGRCVTTTSPTCPNGTVSSDGQHCLGTATAYCAQSVDKLRSDGKCARPAAAPCSNGAGKSDGAGHCVSPTTLWCAPGTGTARSDGLCAVDAEPYCPLQPTQYSGDWMCSTPPKCALGTSLDGQGRCIPQPEDCPAGTADDGHGNCKPVGGKDCPKGTTRTADGSCRQPPPIPDPTHDDQTAGGRTPGDPTPTQPVVEPPDPGNLVISPEIVPAGDPITAAGAGCAPNSEVVLTSDGEEVGRVTADAQGRFSTPVLFGTFTAGERKIIASCGATLTKTVSMTLADSPTGVSHGYVVLLFFLCAGFLVVRWQLGTRR